VKIVYAKTTTSVGGQNGMIQRLTVGEPWNADDPLVIARPDLFSPEPVRVQTSQGWQVVEQATAAPGEKRKRG
jgi:hypothetical protein